MARFGADYYRRFYGRHGVHNRRTISYLAAGVHNMCSWWGVAPKSVLDIGAGPGLWRDWYVENHPRVKVTSIDLSEYACRTYGHEQRDIASWRPGRQWDLSICHGVLQYVPDDQVAAAVGNIAAATRHVLYLELPTAEDFATIVDSSATDMDVHRRPGSFYRSLLEPHFFRAGAGLWVRHGSILLYELERCPS
ncbi:MAG: class I SAM-dependent methyltransferase [Ilumatobacteraceae bacterium]